MKILDKTNFWLRLLQFTFQALLVFWLVLATCELFMPGFAIYYIDLNWLFLLIGILAIIQLFLNKKDQQ